MLLRCVHTVVINCQLTFIILAVILKLSTEFVFHYQLIDTLVVNINLSYLSVMPRCTRELPIRGVAMTKTSRKYKTIFFSFIHTDQSWSSGLQISTPWSPLLIKNQWLHLSLLQYLLISKGKGELILSTSQLHKAFLKAYLET